MGASTSSGSSSSSSVPLSLAHSQPHISSSLSPHLFSHFQAEFDRIRPKATQLQPPATPKNDNNPATAPADTDSASGSASTSPQPSSSSVSLLYSDFVRLRSLPSLPIDFTHLAVLYCIDFTHSGKPTLIDLLNFVAFAESKYREFDRTEFQSRLEGLCIIKLVFDSGCSGSESIADWLCRLVIANKSCIAVDSAPGLVYVHRDSILPLYLSLRRYFPLEVEFSEFFDQLQLNAETVGMLELDEESLDNYIPIAVLRAFVLNVIKGILSIAKSIGLPIASSGMNFNGSEFGAIEQLNASAVKKRRMSKKWPAPLASNRSLGSSGFLSLSPASLRPPVAGKFPVAIGRAKSVSSGIGENSLIGPVPRKNSIVEKSNLKTLKAGRSFHQSTNDSGNINNESTRSIDSAKSSQINESNNLPGSISPIKSSSRRPAIDDSSLQNSRLQSPLNSPSAKRRSPHHGKTQLELPGVSKDETAAADSKRSAAANFSHPSGIPKIPKNKIVPIKSS